MMMEVIQMLMRKPVVLAMLRCGDLGRRIVMYLDKTNQFLCERFKPIYNLSSAMAAMVRTEATIDK